MPSARHLILPFASMRHSATQVVPPDMKILHCLWRGDLGGAERAVYNLVKAQRRLSDLHVGILFGRGSGPFPSMLRADGFDVIDCAFRNGADVLRIRSAARSMRGYDVHHFHSLEPSFFAASLLSDPKARVYTRRSGTISGHPGIRTRLRYAVSEAFLRRYCDAFSANTRHSALEGAAQLRLPEGSIRVIYNGLDFPALEPKREREEVRSDLGFAPDDFLAGTVSVLRSLKRVDLLLEAVAAIPDERFKVLIVGDGPETEHLHRLGAELGLDDRAVFVGLKTQVGDYVNAMDCFVLPSGPRESFANAVVEAMGLGVPSIVFADSPGPCEHVRHGDTGLVVEDPTGLVKAIRSLADDPKLRTHLGRQAALHARGQYDLATMVSGYSDLYQEALFRRGRSS